MMANLISLSEPAGRLSLVVAVTWIQNAMLGSVATVVAIIAIASIGYLMLSGRIDVRRGATVIIGCFILFGSSTIATALRRLAEQVDRSGVGASAAIIAAPPPIAPPPPAPPANYDPFAGAAVPIR